MAKYKIRHSSTNREFGFDALGNLVTTGFSVGAKNGTGVAVKEYSVAGWNTTVFTLTGYVLTVANTTGASFGGAKIYDFPAGRISIEGGTYNLSCDWAGTDIAAAGSGDISFGSTITADATLDGTDVDIGASTGMLDPFVTGVGTAKGFFVKDTEIDGTTTALDLNMNMIIDDADVDDGDSDPVTITGTITLFWRNLGDY